jgi:hypothetical protein
MDCLEHVRTGCRGASRRSATINITPGYYFNPTAFSQAIVQQGQPIPSDPAALAGDLGTDIGNVGRTVLRGPSQSNIDFSVGKRFSLTETKDLQFRADFFNLLNHANRDNPISDISTGDFGKILSFSSSPRIVQLSLKINF